MNRKESIQLKPNFIQYHLSRNSYQTCLSPKYDRQKAHQNQIERKRINKQKLTRFNQYNNIIIAKAHNEIRSQKTNQGTHRFERQRVYEKRAANLSQKYNLYFNVQKNNKNNKQKYLEYLQLQNKQLFKKHLQYNQNLKQITTGVSELESVMQQVQCTYNQLKQLQQLSSDNKKQFQGLWILSDKHIRIYNDQNELQQNYQQKHTNQTIQFQSEKRFQQQQAEINNSNHYDSRYKITHKLNRKQSQHSLLDYQTIQAPSRRLKIQILQDKFKKIVQKLKLSCFESKKQQFNRFHKQSCKLNLYPNSQKQCRQLDQLEREIDYLRSNFNGDGLKLGKKKSYNSIGYDGKNNLSGKNTYKQCEVNNIWNINKVKSLGQLNVY